MQTPARRIFAFLTDAVIYIALVFGWLESLIMRNIEGCCESDDFSIFVILHVSLFFLYFVIIEIISNKSIGKWMLGLYIYNDDSQPRWLQRVARPFLKSLCIISVIGAFVSLAMFIAKNNNRAWYDEALGTTILRRKFKT